MFGRKRESADIQAQLVDAHTRLDTAETLTAEVESRRPWVESLASNIAERRKRNGFGEDFQITLARRG